jgi:hypothetical protein
LSGGALAGRNSAFGGAFRGGLGNGRGGLGFGNRLGRGFGWRGGFGGWGCCGFGLGFGWGWGLGWGLGYDPWLWDDPWYDPWWGWDTFGAYAPYDTGYFIPNIDYGYSVPDDLATPPVPDPYMDNTSSDLDAYPTAPPAKSATSSDVSNSAQLQTSATNTNSAPLVQIYLIDGTVYDVSDYWFADDKLHYVLSGRSDAERAIDVDRLDVQRTVDQNAKRGVAFSTKPSPIN